MDRFDPCGYDCCSVVVLEVFKEIGTKQKNVLDP
jgi:hypothetical protein